MKRRLFNVAAAVSLVVCVATTVLWYVTRDWPRGWPEPTFTARGWDPSFDGGGFSFTHSKQLADLRVAKWNIAFVPTTRSFDLPGLRLRWSRHDVRLLESYEAIPKGTLVPLSSNLVIQAKYGTLVVVFGVLPGLYAGLRAWAVYRRRGYRGRCRVCGYDLRATPERCPECGTAAAAVERTER